MLIEEELYVHLNGAGKLSKVHSSLLLLFIIFFLSLELLNIELIKNCIL